MQTLARLTHLSRFRSDHFDYIVVDEFPSRVGPNVSAHHRPLSSQIFARIDGDAGPYGWSRSTDAVSGKSRVSANVRDGVESGHLCPFHYFGVPDYVEYSNIPWRNSQFDITELAAAVATEARALNALEQFRKHGGRRCIAFCCSQLHADFMADFFLREGLRAAAVHSGPNSAPRATSLETQGWLPRRNFCSRHV